VFAATFVVVRSTTPLGDFMFTRNPSAGPRVPAPRTTGPRANGAQPAFSAPSSGEKSVIGNDLRIIGQGLKIIGRGLLQVDGEIEGDVQGAEVIIGEKGKVAGMVAAQDVIIRGSVSGVVCGRTVALQATSHVEGDVHHMSLAIEQGALFEGRSRRVADEAGLSAIVEGTGSQTAGPSKLDVS
jgi:cytoskeletal protein CcmA (bactofilin family)